MGAYSCILNLYKNIKIITISVYIYLSYILHIKV